ncbi:MAG: guanylate kinase [Candidatus Neomarinimicrobiota bacterium]
MKNLIIISAPSGTGKTTLCRSIQAEISRVKWSVSYTTRKIRKMEKNGIDYQFISESTFKQLIEKSFFAEWEKVHGFYYGTSKDSIKNIIDNNEMLLLEMDVKGALSIKKLYPNKTFSIFITPPSIDHLRKRLQKRGTDSKYRINIRLQRFKEEMKYVSRFDFNLLNDDLAKAKDQLLDIILKIKKGDNNGIKDNTIS